MQFADSAHILHVFQLAGFSNNQGSQFAAMGAGLAVCSVLKGRGISPCGNGWEDLNLGKIK